MKKVIVNRSSGWPVEAPQFEFGAEIEVDDEAASKGIEQGYLIDSSPKPAAKPSPSRKGFEEAPGDD